MAETDGRCVVGEDHTALSEAEVGSLLSAYKNPTNGPAECVQAYDDTCEQYDEFCDARGYTGHWQLAKTMGELYPQQSRRETVRILDVAAGTGLVGVELHKEGFRTMDALDPSQGMLNLAAKRGIYGQLITEYISDKQLPIEENSYDALVLAGGVGTVRYIPVSALHEMVRLVATGGYIVNVMRSRFLTDEFGERLVQLMEQLERDGRWKQVMHSTFPKYYHDEEGVVIVHQVL